MVEQIENRKNLFLKNEKKHKLKKNEKKHKLKTRSFLKIEIKNIN